MYTEEARAFDEQNDYLSFDLDAMLTDLTTVHVGDAVDTLEEEYSIFN